MKTAVAAIVAAARDPDIKKAELVAGAAVGSEDAVAMSVSRFNKGSIGTGRSAGSQSNSQYEVVVLKAPAKRIAGFPLGDSSSSKNKMDSESISPSVRSSYATTALFVSDAGERWKTCTSLGSVISLAS